MLHISRSGLGAVLLSSFLLFPVAGCKRSQDPQAALHAALVPLCRALPTLASQLAQQPLPSPQAAPLLRAGLEPYRARFAALSPQYQALSAAAKRRLMADVSRACATELRAFYVALAAITARFQNEEQAKRLVRETVQSWRDSQSLWAFELFAQDTVAELREMADEEEDEDSDKDNDNDEGQGREQEGERKNVEQSKKQNEELRAKQREQQNERRREQAAETQGTKEAANVR